MNLLIIGNGGREHALAWKVAQSPLTKKVFVAPGNAGTAQEPKVENIPLAPHQIDDLIDFCHKNEVKLTLVGPEAPLTEGITDAFNQADLLCFGPSKNAAKLEGSKSFAKKFMLQHNIPTAAYQSFTDPLAAKEYLKTQSFPLVIKADGLAQGKGVIIAQSLEQANHAIEQLYSSGQNLVIESYLTGEEASFIAICDGQNFISLASSQDHKTRDEYGQGPNTGGMGAYSPAPILTPTIQTQVENQIIQPVLDGMAKNGTPYVGFLYVGLMINSQGQAKVLEFNCRLGDPETQVLLFRLKSDLVELCLNTLQKKLTQSKLEWDPYPALSVVLASAGYPDSYQKGFPISGLPMDTNDYKCFHAGTKQKNQQIVTNGGRVMSLCARGKNLAAARNLVYHTIQSIYWEGMFFRTDIGLQAIKFSKS